MKSGLEGRNNHRWPPITDHIPHISMKSGLEGRNNLWSYVWAGVQTVFSMKSGLEGRNNRDPEGVSLSDVVHSQ